MSRPSRYPAEYRARAVRMVKEVLPQHDSATAAMTAVASQLGIGSVETLRKWVVRTDIDASERPGVISEEHAEIKRLKRENFELRRANEILKSASAFFRSRGARPPVATVIEKQHHLFKGPVWQVRGRTFLRLCPDECTAVFCIPEESANAAAAADPEHAAAVRRMDARRSFLGLEVCHLAGVPAKRAEALIREAWATQAPKRLVNQHTG